MLQSFCADVEKGSTSHSVTLERDRSDNTLKFMLVRPAVAVSSVGPQTSASTNGLRVGDEFSLLNDRDVHSMPRDELMKALIQDTETQPAIAVIARPKLQPISGRTPNTSKQINII